MSIDFQSIHPPSVQRKKFLCVNFCLITSILLARVSCKTSFRRTTVRERRLQNQQILTAGSFAIYPER